MSRRLVQIQLRRERLLARSAAQREELAALLVPLRQPLGIADRGVAVLNYAREHPAAVALAAAVLVVLSPKRAFRWARHAFVAWRSYRWAIRALGELGAAADGPKS